MLSMRTNLLKTRTNDCCVRHRRLDSPLVRILRADRLLFQEQTFIRPTMDHLIWSARAVTLADSGVWGGR